MGYIKHDCIVITGHLWFNDKPDARGAYTKDKTRGISVAHRKAREMGLRVTSIKESQCNGYASFLVIPDGSKEGWDASNEFNGVRAQFIEWLEDPQTEKFDWVALRYGGDDDEISAHDRHHYLY